MSILEILLCKTSFDSSWLWSKYLVSTVLSHSISIEGSVVYDISFNIDGANAVSSLIFYLNATGRYNFQPNTYSKMFVANLVSKGEFLYLNFDTKIGYKIIAVPLT